MKKRILLKTLVLFPVLACLSAACNLYVPRLRDVKIEPSPLNMKVGDTTKLTAIAIPQREEITNQTWSTDDAAVATVDDEGNVTAVNPGQTKITVAVIINEDDEYLEATCEVTVSETFTVTFDGNGSSSVVDPVKAEKGARITEPEVPVKTGYNFGGWYKEPALENRWNFGGDTVTVSITLYAKWLDPGTVTYTVTFYSNGGSDIPPIRYIEAGTKISQPAIPAREGRLSVFGGWYTDAAFTEGSEYKFGTEITGDVNLYARWLPYDTKTFTVTFDTGTGGPEVARIEGLVSGVYIPEPTPPAKEGFIFEFWYDSSFTSESRAKAYDFEKTPITADLTLIAKWSKLSIYSISLSPAAHTFPAATAGYTTAPTLTVTVANTGNESTGGLAVALGGTDAESFTLAPANGTLVTIPVTGTNTRTFTVAPKTGLAAKTYTATVTVGPAAGNANAITPQTLTVSFTVNPAGGGGGTPLDLLNAMTGGLTLGVGGNNSPVWDSTNKVVKVTASDSSMFYIDFAANSITVAAGATLTIKYACVVEAGMGAVIAKDGSNSWTDTDPKSYPRFETSIGTGDGTKTITGIKVSQTAGISFQHNNGDSSDAVYYVKILSVTSSGGGGGGGGGSAFDNAVGMTTGISIQGSASFSGGIIDLTDTSGSALFVIDLPAATASSGTKTITITYICDLTTGDPKITVKDGGWSDPPNKGSYNIYPTLTVGAETTLEIPETIYADNTASISFQRNGDGNAFKIKIISITMN